MAVVIPFGENITVSASKWSLGDRILQPYCIAKTPVTYKLWEEIYNWAVNHNYEFYFNYTEPEQSDLNFVTNVIWQNCLIWCNAYTEKTLGKEHCVYYDYRGILRDYNNCVYAKHEKRGYRLADRGEWEFFARGANLNSKYWNKYNFYDLDEDISEIIYESQTDCHYGKSRYCYLYESGGIVQVGKTLTNREVNTGFRLACSL